MASRICASAAGMVATSGVFRLLNRPAQQPRKPCFCESVRNTCAATDGPKRIRVMSQNIWNSFFAGGPGRHARLMAFFEELERLRVDIVIVQEMFVFGLGPWCVKSEAEAARELLLELGFRHQTCPTATQPLLGQSSGLVVYSKYPIVREHHEAFATRRSVTAKGWLEVVIDLGLSDSNQVQHLLLPLHCCPG